MLPPPILDKKHLSTPSVFSPDALLREARRQKNLPPFSAPEVCILDPDGDLVRRQKDKNVSRKIVIRSARLG